jgi:pyruvate/2-oxoglutarate dehydrogenase complex dihydrolipoamide acyltransferase (E2) component
MPSVELHKYSKPALWRRMALVNWGYPSDPQVYGRMEVEMTGALEYIRRESERTGISITVTHLILRAMALCMKAYPDVNVLIRWNRVYLRKRINIFCQVAVPGKKPELLGVLVRDADAKDVAAIAREIKEKAAAIRNGTDRELVRTLRMLDRIPGFLYGPALRLVNFFQYTLNVDLGRFGIPRDPFGGAAVTDLGSLGVSEAFAPLPPITRMPIVVSVGKVEEKPVVREGQIVIRPVCVLCLTFDHRMMDGYRAGKVVKFVKRYLADPEKIETPAQPPVSVPEE